MNDHFNKFIGELSNLSAHQTGRFWWASEVDILNRMVRIDMRDRISDMRLARIIPFDYIIGADPVGQARKVIEDMQAEMESKTTMSLEEVIDQLDDLANDVWYGAREGRPIYVSEDDCKAIRIAIDMLQEKQD